MDNREGQQHNDDPRYPTPEQAGGISVAPQAYPNQPSYPSAPYTPPAYTPPAYTQPEYAPSAYTPSASNWAPSQPTPPRRPVWPYIVGALLLFVLLLAGIFAVSRFAAARSATTVPAIGQGGQTVVVPPAAQDLQQTVINVIRTAQPSVVEVTSTSGRGQAIGSGIVLTKDGYIATNDHVVHGFSNYTVTLANNTKLNAQLVGESGQDDLAVLKISASDLQPLAFADSGTVQIGEFSIALGSPLGLDQSSTFGIVSALNRTESEGQGGTASVLTGLIQTSAPINPGNSGGALVDLQGRLIGIPTLGASSGQTGGSANGIGFAIPSNRVQFVSQQIIKNGGSLTSTGQGFLGIQAQTPTSGGAGIQVGGFANDASGKSPAQTAGVRVGDVIIKINGQAITDNNSLAAVLLNKSPGTQVTLTVTRGGAQQDIQVTLGERPSQTNG